MNIAPVNVEQRKGLDYTKKETWSADNMSKIAGVLGYILNKGFETSYNQFVTTLVANAKITGLLLTVAQNYFENVKPPLERANHK